MTFDVEPTTQRGAYRKEHGIVAPPELVEGDVPAQLRVVVDLDAEIDDGVQLVLQQRAVEAVLRDSELHHATELGSRLVDGDVVAEPAQVVGTSHPSRAASDDSHALRPIFDRRRRYIEPDLSGLRLRAVLFGDESLERTDRNRLVDLSAPAGILTRRRAHSAAHRGKRIG